ncbi:hypothetical protein Ddc_15741 [Ditylenchus destructor]|nr:hypothetical protein Ddc_15741 [Ditylenchus destructor]
MDSCYYRYCLSPKCADSIKYSVTGKPRLSMMVTCILGRKTVPIIAGIHSRNIKRNDLNLGNFILGKDGTLKSLTVIDYVLYANLTGLPADRNTENHSGKQLISAGLWGTKEKGSIDKWRPIKRIERKEELDLTEIFLFFGVVLKVISMPTKCLISLENGVGRDSLSLEGGRKQQQSDDE